jgi:hypothetical protein
MDAWIGIDLDGTLAYYDHWRGADHIGEPVPKMLLFVQDLLKQGHKVKLFTARASIPAQIPVIQRWLEKHSLPLEVTCTKDFGMTCLYDDRCVQIEKNTGRQIVDKPNGV